MTTLTIGKKIGWGFAVQIALAAVLGCVAIVSMKSAGRTAGILSTEFVPEAEIAGNVSSSMAKAQLAIRSYGYTAEAHYLAEAKSNLEEVKKHMQAAKTLTEQHPDLVKLKEEMGRLDPLLKEYDQLVQQTEAKNKDIVTSRDKLNKSAQSFLANIDKLIGHQEEMMTEEIKAFTSADKLKERFHKISLVVDIRGEGNAARVAVFKSQALRDPKVIEEGLKNFDVMNKRFEELTPLVKVAQDIAELNEVKKDANEYATTMKEIMADYLALTDMGKKRIETASAIAELVDHVSATGMKRTVQAAGQSRDELATASWIITAVLGVVLAVATIIAFFTIRSITRPIKAVAMHLSEGADQTASAASQVSASSQSLAEGATEQAASLEETSSSLEEMSSMTKKNTENAQHTNDLAKQARAAAETGAADMQTMGAAINEIKVSSDEVAKIIKTIDEIAFQTNILALNAAVEAARAGEAGMGFAVVADEVRNLAQRAAQAAKETSGKIETAVSKTAQGVQISAKVAQSLQEIVAKVRQVDELAAEVATASKEQSQGIEQVNSAVTQMDKVTQSNAANAEESASASEELNTQAEVLRGAVGDLLQLVDGNKHEAGAITPAKLLGTKVMSHPAAAHTGVTLRVEGPVNGNGHGGNGHGGNGHANKVGQTHSEPELAAAGAARGGDIPMDGDFKRF